MNKEQVRSIVSIGVMLAVCIVVYLVYDAGWKAGWRDRHQIEVDRIREKGR